MTPDYTSRDGRVMLYRQDCVPLMKQFQQAGECFDALICDPPYGVGESSKAIESRNTYRKGMSKAKAYQRDYGDFAWDDKTDQAGIDLARSLTTHHAIWGGNYYQLPPTSCWLVWDKENGETDFADAELCWTNWKKAVRLRRHLWNGMLRKGQEQRYHPTQKPLGVMQWVIRLCPDHDSIIDPYAGSGTTGVAAIMAGKSFTGIERDERYFARMVKRIEKAYEDTGLLTLAEAGT